MVKLAQKNVKKTLPLGRYANSPSIFHVFPSRVLEMLDIILVVTTVIETPTELSPQIWDWLANIEHSNWLANTSIISLGLIPYRPVSAKFDTWSAFDFYMGRTIQVILIEVVLWFLGLWLLLECYLCRWSIFCAWLNQSKPFFKPDSHFIFSWLENHYPDAMGELHTHETAMRQAAISILSKRRDWVDAVLSHHKDDLRQDLCAGIG